MTFVIIIPIPLPYNRSYQPRYQAGSAGREGYFCYNTFLFLCPTIDPTNRDIKQVAGREGYFCYGMNSYSSALHIDPTNRDIKQVAGREGYFCYNNSYSSALQSSYVGLFL